MIPPEEVLLWDQCIPDTSHRFEHLSNKLQEVEYISLKVLEKVQYCN